MASAMAGRAEGLAAARQAWSACAGLRATLTSLSVCSNAATSALLGSGSRASISSTWVDKCSWQYSAARQPPWPSKTP